MKLSELKSYTVAPRTSDPTLVQAPQKDLLQTASDIGGFLFPGTKEIGESLGTIGVAGERALKGDIQGAQEVLKTQKTVPELLGAYAASSASLLGSAGVGTSGGVISKALQSAGLGAAISGGRSLAEGKKTEDVLASTAVGAGVGAGTSLAFSGGEALLKSVRALPERLIRSATGQSKREILAGKDISKYVIENRKVGTADQLIRSSQQAIDEADDIIARGLESASKSADDAAISTVSRHLQEAQDVLDSKSPNFEQLGGLQGLKQRLKENIASGLQAEGKDAAADAIRNLDDELYPSINDLAKAAQERIKLTSGVPLKGIINDITDSINASGGEIDEAGVRSILETLAPQSKKTLRADFLSPAEANRLRSQLDKTLGDRAFLMSQLPFNKGVLMDFTNALREQVKGRAPDGVREAFNILSNEIRLRNLLVSKVAGASRNQIIGLGDLLSGGFGGAFGGIPGAITAASLKRAAESTLTKTATAQLVTALDKSLSPVLSNLEPATQTAIINAIVAGISALETERQLEDQPYLPQ